LDPVAFSVLPADSDCMKTWFLLFLITFVISSTQAADVVVYKGTFRTGGSFEETPILPRSGSAYFVVDYTIGHSWIIYYFNKNGRRQRSAIADWNMTRAPRVDGRFATAMGSGNRRRSS